MCCHRLIPCCLGAAGLLLVALALWLPRDVEVRAQDSVPEPPSKDAKLVAAECAFFVTFKPADFSNDDLAKAIFQELSREMERDLRLPLSEIERVTFAVVRGGPVTVVRTRKAYDSDKLRTAFMESRHGFKDKDGGPRKPVVNEKKAGGKTVYYTGQLGRWNQGWVPFDRTTYLSGQAVALVNLLQSKAKPSEEMSKALDLAGKHSLVLALEGKQLRAVMKHERKERERDRKGWDEIPPPKDGFKEKEGFNREEIAVRGRRGKLVPIAAQKEKGKEDKTKDEDDGLDELFGRGEGIVMVPYKPLLNSEFGLLTLDIKKTYKLAVRIDCKDKDQLDDAETALKSLLYVARELAVMLPRQEHGLQGLKPLSEPFQKAFKAAKIERKGNALSTTVTLTPEAGLGKKIREGMDEERKREDERRKERFRDKDKGFKDKGF